MSLTTPTISSASRGPQRRVEANLPKDTRSLGLKAEHEREQARWALVFATFAIIGSTLIRAVFFDSLGTGIWVDIALGLIQVGVLGAAVHFSRSAASSHIYYDEENATAKEVASTESEQNEEVAEADKIEADHAATLDEIETAEAIAGHEVEAQHHNVGRQKEWMRGMADQFASDTPGDSLYTDIRPTEPSKDLDPVELHGQLWGHKHPPVFKTPVVADQLRGYSNKVEDLLTDLEYTAATTPEPELGGVLEGMPHFCPWGEPETTTSPPATSAESEDAGSNLSGDGIFVFMDADGHEFSLKRIPPETATTNGHDERRSGDD